MRRIYTNTSHEKGSYPSRTTFSARTWLLEDTAGSTASAAGGDMTTELAMEKAAKAPTVAFCSSDNAFWATGLGASVKYSWKRHRKHTAIQTGWHRMACTSNCLRFGIQRYRTTNLPTRLIRHTLTWQIGIDTTESCKRGKEHSTDLHVLSLVCTVNKADTSCWYRLLSWRRRIIEKAVLRSIQYPEYLTIRLTRPGIESRVVLPEVLAESTLVVSFL